MVKDKWIGPKQLKELNLWWFYYLKITNSAHQIFGIFSIYSSFWGNITSQCVCIKPSVNALLIIWRNKKCVCAAMYTVYTEHRTFVDDMSISLDWFILLPGWIVSQFCMHICQINYTYIDTYMCTKMHITFYNFIKYCLLLYSQPIWHILRLLNLKT